MERERGGIREHFVEFAEGGGDVVGGGKEVFDFVYEGGSWDASWIGISKDSLWRMGRRVRCLAGFGVCHSW